MVESLIDFFGNLPKELVVFIISLFPIVELRGGLIAASILGVPWFIAFPICVLGNMLPIPFILLFIKQIFKILKKIKFMRILIEKIEGKADKKGSKLNKGRILGLFAFVAIPLPGTGAWMGALIANMLDIRIKKSFPTIFLGVFTAGIIMLIIAYALPDLFSTLFGFNMNV